MLGAGYTYQIWNASVILKFLSMLIVRLQRSEWSYSTTNVCLNNNKYCFFLFVVHGKQSKWILENQNKIQRKIVGWLNWNKK